MGMHAALVTTWGSPVPGREGKSIEAFMDYLTLLGKQAADDNVSEPQAFFKYDGSGGMGMVQGDSAKLLELWESMEFREMLSKAQLTVQDLHTEIYAAGDTVQDLVGNFSRVAGEMGYMERSADRRSDVRAVMPTARSVISLATVYNTDRPYSTERADASTALIARYAWGDDYHEVIQQRMDFQELMRDRFATVVEQATGRTVIGFMSGNQQDPDIMCEVFILAPTDLVDDHEIADNTWSGGALNHLARQGAWSTRLAAAYRAYREWLPVREALATLRKTL